jgi:hypothetical protein
VFIETEANPLHVDVSVDDVRDLVTSGQFGRYACLSASHSEFVIASTEATEDVAPWSRGLTGGYRVEYWRDDYRRVLRGRASLSEVTQLMVGFAVGEAEWMNGFEWVELPP